MQVEVAFALPERQFLQSVELADGGTVADAIARSELAQAFPEIEIEQLQTGVWGRLAERNHVLVDGDRVELYRPLEMDPREARRLKAGS
jgi:putative ubiquitin-RnfH superfamily antitoxin RatB of RatAB toxin-antitoxin module